jgi:ribosomal-protein-alanine N-acetyltransferase
MIIGIDCSSKEGGLATDEQTFYPLNWVEDITAKIAELGINVGDIEKILITYGPGSFTSLRVGLVTAQGLAFPRDIPILAYSTFLAMVEEAPFGNLFPLIPARYKVVYAAYYRKSKDSVKEVFTNRVFNISELINYLDNNYDRIKKPIIFGEGAEKNRDFLNEREYSVAVYPDYKLACNLFNLYKNNADCLINPEVPLYLSRSAAIRKRDEAEIEIREMKEEDIKDILEIEKDVFPSPWTYEMFYTLFLTDACVKLVAVLSGNVVGYIMGCEEGDRFHLGNLAVSRSYWRKGFGTKLLSYLLEQLAREPKIKFCDLEHRIYNEAAFELYKSLGFTYKGIKKDYYKKGEDAVVMGIKCS